MLCSDGLACLASCNFSATYAIEIVAEGSASKKWLINTGASC